MSDEQTVVLPDGFTQVSVTWPKYAERVLFFRAFYLSGPLRKHLVGSAGAHTGSG